jgi:hypothetical protein
MLEIRRLVTYRSRTRDVCIDAFDCSEYGVAELDAPHSVFLHMLHTILQECYVTGIGCCSQTSKGFDDARMYSRT